MADRAQWPRSLLTHGIVPAGPRILAEEQKLSGALTEDEQQELERLMGKLADAASPDRELW